MNNDLIDIESLDSNDMHWLRILHDNPNLTKRQAIDLLWIAATGSPKQALTGDQMRSIRRKAPW